MRWELGPFEVLRVEDPGFSLRLPADPAAAALSWLRGWAVDSESGELVIGSSATVIRAGATTVVVDPFLAFDGSVELGDRMAALAAAGVDPAEVDVVVNSHHDGIGTNLAADGTPAFPRARYLLPAQEWATAAAAWAPIEAAGRLELVHGGEEVVPGVRLEPAPGHNPGQVVVWLGDDAAVVVGHLFLHPAQIAVPSAHVGDLDPAELERTRRRLLARAAAAGSLLVGPLFAAPGAGTPVPDGDTWRLDLIPGRAPPRVVRPRPCS